MNTFPKEEFAWFYNCVHVYKCGTLRKVKYNAKFTVQCGGLRQAGVVRVPNNMHVTEERSKLSLRNGNVSRTIYVMKIDVNWGTEGD